MNNYRSKTNEVLRKAARDPLYGMNRSPLSVYSGLQTTFEMNEAKRNAAAHAAKYAPVKKWATVQTRKNRKASRKTRKNRKASRKASRKANRR